MYCRKIIIIIICLLSHVFFSSEINAQVRQDSSEGNKQESLAFKKSEPVRGNRLFYQLDLSYQLWQLFSLIREANSGDPFAQHELGLRYLMGEGTPADTLKGAYWIQKAAAQKLTSAMYNYGILLMNGIGVKWDPFEAYNYFLKAAKDSMAQAEYVIGILYTENLIVKRDWLSAYKWITKAADSDLDYATETLLKLEEKIPPSLLDTSNFNISSEPTEEIDESFASTLRLAFIDFDAVGDTIKEITDEMLQKDLVLIGNEKLTDSLKISSDEIPQIDSSDIPILLKAAEAGSPEALTYIGRLYEKGIYFEKNIIKASAYYLRALRLDSPKAPWLLWKVTGKDNYFTELKTSFSEGNPEAMFVWYGLYANGFGGQIVKEDAINMLKEAANRNYLPALNELGLIFNNGKMVDKSEEKAYKLWRKAEKMGSSVAKDRIATAKIFGFLPSSDLSTQIKILGESNSSGSILAQAALAYAYENGIGVNKDKGEAASLYRLAAQRGSRYAYNQLKRMYDEVRPEEGKFTIN